MTASAATVVPRGIAPAGRRLEAVPGRARDVQLLGEFAGSGYREAPTLVRRGDGQLIKLTPLLYELIDAIDGRRGHEELAVVLGRRVGKQATAEDVRFLIERKLQPLGLLRGRDGQQPEMERSNPLLALRPRVVVSKPELTHMLTAPFVWLFKPLVMIPLSLAFAAISSWLLIDEGLSSALHQAFYEPGLILVIWALVVLSAAFHEIGHAAACRYGGAKPGVIGGGLYLVWPAFYTEVSDAYRLSRRGRLRIDFGGLYFSAIFAVATAGLWRLTGADALLLIIAVQLLQMVRQLAPFIRADGYHIVSDLVGVPDLFAHIKPTLLGMLPTRWGRPEHKVLKPWARAVVTGWVAITVPTLVAVLGLIVLVLPRLAATTWDSTSLRWEETTVYWSAGDVAGVAMSGISIALAALPALSIVYLVSYVARSMALRAWRGTAGRPRLRALAALGGAAVIGFLAWAWWPGDQYRPIDAHEGPMPAILVPPPPVEPVQLLQLSSPLPIVPAAPAPVSLVPSVYVLNPGFVLDTPETDIEPGPVPPSTGGDASGTSEWPSPFDPPEHAAPGTDAPEPSDAAPSASWAESLEPAGPAPPAPAEPAEAGEASEPPAWPFPFDPPEPAELHDNRAIAVNTTDGSALWDFAFALSILEAGLPLEQANEAYAFASCGNCLTGAVAFQVLLVVGQVDEIVPINIAVAANYACGECITYAFAYQIVAGITEVPDAEVQTLLDLAMQRLRDLEANAGSLTGQEIHLELESIKQDYLDALQGILTLESVESATAAPPEAGAGEVETEPSPTESTPDPGAASEAPEEPVADSQAEESVTQTSAEEPAAETPAEEPAAETPAEEPAAETPAEEPAAEGEVEEPVAETETTAPITCAGAPTGECPEEPLVTEETTAPEPTAP